MKLGRNIRKYRQQLGFSRSEFARRVGVSPTAVQNWEDRDVQPRSELIPIISGVLCVEPEHLVEEGVDRSDESLLNSDKQASVQELKRRIAQVLGVSPAKIEIVVRY